MLCDSSGVTGTGAAIGPTTRISVASLIPRLTRWSWSRRAPRTARAGTCTADQDPDEDGARLEARERVAHPLGAGHRVELEAALREPRRGGRVLRRSQSHDEDVRVVRGLVGRHPPRLRREGGHAVPPELDPGLRERGVRGLHVRAGSSSNSTSSFENPKTNDSFWSKRHVHLVGQRLGETRRQHSAPRTRPRGSRRASSPWGDHISPGLSLVPQRSATSPWSTGFTSRIGVPSTASRLRTRARAAVEREDLDAVQPDRVRPVGRAGGEHALLWPQASPRG